MRLTRLSLAIATTTTATLMISPAFAGGLERSQQSVGTLFQDGNYAEVTLAHVAPKIKAKDMMGNDASGMIQSYNDVEAAVKIDTSDKTSVAVFYNKPWAVETTYSKENMFSNELGSTEANVTANSVNFMAAHKLNKNFTVYGGVDIQNTSGKVQAATPVGEAAAIQGAYGEATQEVVKRSGGLVTGTAAQDMAKGIVDTALTKAKNNETLNNDEADVVNLVSQAAQSPTLYEVEFKPRTTLVPAIGFAYEKPEIALRTAVTYRGAAKYKIDTEENLTVRDFPSENRKNEKSVTEINFPQSVTVNFQTGLSEKHQLLGMADARWVEWSKFKVDPKLSNELQNGEPLASYDKDDISMSVGLGKQMTPKLSAEARVNFGIGGDKEDPLSLLGPYGAVTGYSVGAQYKVSDDLNVSGGAQYMTIDGGTVPSGDPNNPLITVDDSDGFAVGVNVGYNF